MKQVRLAAEVGGLTAATVKPNFRALGPRFGRRMKEVTAAIAAADPAAVAARAASGDPVQVGEFELHAEDLVVEMAPREAYAIAAESGCQVGVLKELTPELRAEGMVREAVHMINNHRRESGYSIVDRITLFLGLHNISDPVALKDLQGAFLMNEALIRSEVLANEVHYGLSPEGADTRQVTVAGYEISVGTIRE